MKKDYITPKANVYAVNPCEVIALSTGSGASDEYDVLVKEQKEEKGAGIWDLY